MNRQLVSHSRCPVCGRLCIEGTPHFCGSTYEALERALREALRENEKLTREIERLKTHNQPKRGNR